MPGANLCHLPAYSEMVRRATGHPVLYLVAREQGAVRGVLPLTHIRSPLFGNLMISHAFRNYGGPLAADAEATEALFRRAVEIATERGCSAIELRRAEPLPFDLHTRTGKVCMVLPLDPDPKVMWKGLDFKMRNHVRKAEKAGLVAVDGGQELLDGFYGVYTHRMRELGSPPYAKKVFRTMLETFPENSRLFAVRLDRLVLAAGITTEFKGVVEIPYAGSLSEYNKLCPNNLLYWTIIKHYSSAGAKSFDFGRCAVGSGTYQFKKQWGTQPLALNYQFWVRAGHELSVNSTDNPRYRSRIEMWKKLPLWLTRAVGPWISRDVP